MFKCEFCDSIVGPAVGCVKVVVEKSAVKYPPRFGANHVSKETENRFKWKREAAKSTGVKVPDPHDDPGGSGWRIVKEAHACQRCAAEFQSK